MALEAATIAGPVKAPERKPVEITPETTAKQLASAVEGSEEASGRLGRNAAWLQAGPFSGHIIQALFGIPFRAEEVSADPLETLAAIYLKIRRLWPVYPTGDVAWLLGVMRDWWGGIPAGALPRTPPTQQSESEPADEDWDMPWQLDISFTTSGTTAHVPVRTDYSVNVEFDDEDKDVLREIRRRYRSGELTKAAAISGVRDFLDERVRDIFYDGNADEGDDHWDEEYAEIDRDDESIDDIGSHDEAAAIVDAWA